MLYNFGSGTLWGVNTAVNPTPIKFGTLQSFSLSMDTSTKPLYGQYQFPVAVGRGTTKVQGKAKYAAISGLAFTSLFLNTSFTAGQTTTANDEVGTITAGAITVANSATFTTDLGVLNAATGLPFIRVASAPATGQYSVAAGVYTFNTGQNATAVKISYVYTTSGGGSTVITNPLIGVAPTFKIAFENTYNNSKSNFVLNSCTASKFNLFDTKIEDWNIQEFDFDVFVDSAGNLGTFSMNEFS
jgi:hypothetical protein